MFQNLFLHSVLPTRMLQMEDFLGGVSMIPLRGSQPPPPSARHDGGLLSALSSYLMTPYGSSSEALVPDATDADIENTLCSMDCITSCRLDEFYGQIMWVFLLKLYHFSFWLLEKAFRSGSSYSSCPCAWGSSTWENGCKIKARVWWDCDDI